MVELVEERETPVARVAGAGAREREGFGGRRRGRGGAGGAEEERSSLPGKPDPEEKGINVAQGPVRLCIG